MQLVEELAVLGLAQERDDARSHARPDVLELLELLLRDGEKGLEVGIATGQNTGARGSHVADAQRKELVAPRSRTAGGDSVDQVACRLGRETLELDEILDAQAVQVGEVAYQPLFDKQAYVLRSQSGDVHGVARSKMLQAAFELLRTARVLATNRHLVFDFDQRRLARRATFREAKALFLAGALLLDDARHLGNHVSTALDHDGIADAYTETTDLVAIVQRGTRDRDAVQPHGLEVGGGRHSTGTAHLNDDVVESGLGLSGFVLESDGPTRCLGSRTELALLGQRVDLDDDAVDLVFQLVAFGAKGVDGREKRVHVGAMHALRIDRKAALTQALQHLPVRAQPVRLRLDQLVHEPRHRPFRHLVTIEHLQ